MNCLIVLNLVISLFVIFLFLKFILYVLEVLMILLLFLIFLNFIFGVRVMMFIFFYKLNKNFFM